MPPGGKYLRCNYRLTGNKIDVGGLASVLVNFRITIQHDSANGDLVTFSMEGYGVPDWVLAEPASDAVTFTYVDLIRASIAASLVYLTIDGATGSMGSLAATVSMPWNITALISSR